MCFKSEQLCQKPGIENLEKLKEYTTKREKLGELKFAPFCKGINKLSENEHLLSRYHCSCYKEIVHILKTPEISKTISRIITHADKKISSFSVFLGYGGSRELVDIILTVYKDNIYL